MYVLKLEDSQTVFAVVTEGADFNQRVCTAIEEELNVAKVELEDNFKSDLDWGEEHEFTYTYLDDDGFADEGVCTIILIAAY